MRMSRLHNQCPNQQALPQPLESLLHYPVVWLVPTLLAALLLSTPSELRGQDSGQWKETEKYSMDSDEPDWESGPIVVRIWDSFPHLNLEFSWEGPVNDRGEAHGTGTLAWFPSKTAAYDSNEWVSEYRGEMVDGKKNGKGKIIMRSGASYTGGWRQNLKHGTGSYHYASGAVYQGAFENDQEHGQGLLLGPDGVLYQGPFVKGNPHGRGETFYPEGTSYASDWDSGVETAASLARGRKAARGGSSNLNLGLFLDPKSMKQFREELFNDSSNVISYRAEWREGGLSIEPDFAKWQEREKGVPVKDAFEAGIGPAFIEAELHNQSKDAVTVTGGELRVDSSQLDLEPFIHLIDDDAPMWFKLLNAGWGPARDCVLSFNLVSVAERPDFKVPFQFQRKLGVIDKECEILLVEELSSKGVDTELLLQDESFSVANARDVLGPFARFSDEGEWLESDVKLVGNLSYLWTNAEGQDQKASVPVLAHIVLDPRAEKGAGGPSDASFRLLLRDESAAYRVPFEFSRRIAPGERTRIELHLAAPRSSFHEFRVALHTSEGDALLSRNCHLRFFIPRQSSENYLEGMLP